MKSTRGLIVTAIVGVAIVLGFVALRGVRVPPEGTEGAIGAANRYQAGQIDAKDVELQDAEIQAFLQTDTFHKLATNPEFRKLALELSFQEATRMQAYRELMKQETQAASLANKEFVAFLVDPATLELVRSRRYMQMSAECNMAELLRTPAFYVLMSSTLENKPTAVEFRQLVMKSKELAPSFVEFANKSPETVLEFISLEPRMLQMKELMVSLNGAAELLASPDAATLLESKAFTDLIRLQAHEELMKTPQLLELAYSSEVFNKIVEAQQWSALERGWSEIRTQ